MTEQIALSVSLIYKPSRKMNTQSKVLLIIDPQNDFVEGTLPVPGAVEAMQWLAEMIDKATDYYHTIIITMDQHPLGHCSFINEGGQWPIHCVRYSWGAAIYPIVMEAIQQARSRGVEIVFIEKATNQEVDEYSAFSQHIPDQLLRAHHIDIAGLAGDYCVRQSYEDLVKYIDRSKITLLNQGIAWINPS